MIKRIEIDKDYADILSELMLGDEFPWYWNSGTLYPETDDGCVIDSKTKDSHQFTHTIYLNNQPQTEYYHYFTEMVHYLEPHIGKIKRVIRIKSNLMVGDGAYPEGLYNGPHVDYHGDNLLSFVYYVNDSDGDTVIFDEHLDGNPHNLTELTEVDRQTPKAGSGIVFNSQRVHTSSTPRFTDRRVVINYVFEMYETNDTKF
jgi:hypothetical protein